VGEAWLDELREFIAIPSVSADPAHRQDVVRAAEWLADLVKHSGGEAEVTPFGERELVLGEIPASSGDGSAPTILVYGHFDVQPPAPLELWESGPFELTERDGWYYARGIADDKGQLFTLVKAAQLLAEQGELPVNVRIASDGEEEIGGHTIVDFLAQDERGADACVVFDGHSTRPEQLEFSVGTRGLVGFRITVRTGSRDMHSGIYGGGALNAIHALMEILGAVVARDGVLPEPLRQGCAPLRPEEKEAAAALPSGHVLLQEAGATPLDPRAGDEFYLRNWAQPSLDVNGIYGGKPEFVNTTLPVEAHARFTIRLAPGQDLAQIQDAAEQLLRDAAREGAELEIIRENSAPPGLVPTDTRAMQLALDAFERALGKRPLLVRAGGTLPIVPALVEKGIPTVLSGFALPESNAHSPNERMRVEDLPRSIAAAQELFRAWGELG
jgi:acetylornithine deacetylase/succinyl-diaminopimelate desuccinylase-like protein